jgi:hypothetical protein
MRAEEVPGVRKFKTRDEELTPEQLDWCRGEAEQALEPAAKKIFGPLPPPETKDAIRARSRIAPQDTKTADTISAQILAKNGAATTQEDRRHAEL